MSPGLPKGGEGARTGKTLPAATAPAPTSAPAPRAPLTPLTAPGDPNESLFNGMDSVPGGGGSEALIQSPDQNLTMTALGLLDSLGEEVSPQVAMIKNYLRAQANNGILQ